MVVSASAGRLAEAVQGLQQLGQALLDGGWDINLLAVLAADCEALAGSLPAQEGAAHAAALARLAAAVRPWVGEGRLPDHAGSSRIAAGVHALASLPLPEAWRRPVAHSLQVPLPAQANGYPLQSLPPPGHLQRAAAWAAAPVAPRPAPAREDSAGPAAPDVAAALAESRLELAFQPIVSLHGEAGARYQALLRLRARDGSLHGPAAVLPAAARAGLLRRIDRWVAAEAARVVAGHGQSPVQVFISQSPGSLRDVATAAMLEEEAARHGVAPGSLCLELPLAEALAAPLETAALAEALGSAGIALVLAGVTPGPDSERVLARLRPDFVRLAAGRLQLEDAQAGEALQALVEALHARGVRVIAPQVESAGQASTYWRAGVDYLQGNLVQQAGHALGFDFGS